MANYGGNSFPFTKAETSAERLPIWNRVDHKKYIGKAVIPDETYTVGKVFKIGTPVEIGADNEKVKFGAEATKPDGLLLAEFTVGDIGATAAIVYAGSIRVNLLDVEITDEQWKALPMIDQDKEYFIQNP